jgi:hypothetical protein
VDRVDPDGVVVVEPEQNILAGRQKVELEVVHVSITAPDPPVQQANAVTRLKLR